MASLRSVSFVTFSTCFWIFVLANGDYADYSDLDSDVIFPSSDIAEITEVTAHHGETVTLPCERPRYTNITAVEWTRPDREPEYVFVYQDKQSALEHQHLSFKNRVELKDSEMKDGDVSLILRDVTRGDAGKYQCNVSTDTESSESFVILYVHPEVTAHHGETVTLPCERPRYTNITAVEWARPDREPEYVFVYQDKQSALEHQHLSFKNRVELKDSEMKDGDVSLILRDVTRGDAGKYQCKVSTDTKSSESFVILYVHPAPINITSESGETVSLPCEHPSNTLIRTVKWIRPDLDPETVYLNSINRFMMHHDQHPSFKNRVELKFCDVMNGKMLLILKNVSINDTGTYECRVDIDVEIISIVHLHVYPSGDPGLTMLRIVLYIVVFCPYFISTLLMVSLYRCRHTGRNLPFSTITSPPNWVHEGLDKQNDENATEHYF